MKGYVSALLGMAAEDIEASACAEISAGNALDMALCARHARYYLALAEEAEPHLNRREQPEWLDRLEDEHDNVRAALRWSMDGGDIQAGLRAASALPGFWWYRGYVVEGYRWLTALLARPGTDTPTSTRAKALAWVGRWSGIFEDTHRGRAILRESLDLARHTEAPWVAAFVLDRLGTLAARDGDMAQGRHLMHEAIQLFREVGDQRWIARSLSFLANLELLSGDVIQAKKLLAEALATARQSGDRSMIGQTLEVLGQVESAQGQHARAHHIWEQSIAMYQTVGNRQGIVSVRVSQGRLAVLLGDDAGARTTYLECLTRMRDQGGYRLKEVLEGLAILAARRGLAHQVLILARAGDRLTGSGYPGTVTDRAMYEQALSLARQELGEERAAAAWAEGQALTRDEAYDLAVAVASDKIATIDI